VRLTNEAHSVVIIVNSVLEQFINPNPKAELSFAGEKTKEETIGRASGMETL
jgi:hypothetical protein